MAKKRKQLDEKQQPNDQHSIEDVIVAIRGSKGIKAVAYRRLGCTAVTLNSYIKKYPEVEEAYLEERQGIVDLAEAKLIEQVKGGNWHAIRWVLATLGKDRGYVERVEQSQSGDITIHVKYGDQE